MLFPTFRRTLKALSGVFEPRRDVVTLTLDLSQSGPLPPETRQFLKHRALKSLRQGHWGPGLRKTADRIEDYVTSAVRPETEGLFLVAGPGLWESFELALPLRNFLWVGSTPYVAPLLDLEERAPRSLLVIADRSSVRLEELYLGRRAPLARTELRSEAADPQRTVNLKASMVRSSGARFSRRSDATNERRSRHENERVGVVFRDAGRKITAFWRSMKPSTILFFGDRRVLPALAEGLPKAIASQLTFVGSPPRSDHELAPVALRSLERKARERRTHDTRRLLDMRAQGRLVSLGPNLVLARLADGTAERIYLDPYDPVPGTACTNCGGRFAEQRRACGFCGSPLDPVSLTQEIVASELSHPEMGVTFVTKPAKWLDEIGGLVAIRRPLSAG
jgi:hypothetical protein